MYFSAIAFAVQEILSNCATYTLNLIAGEGLQRLSSRRSNDGHLSWSFLWDNMRKQVIDVIRAYSLIRASSCPEALNLGRATFLGSWSICFKRVYFDGNFNYLGLVYYSQKHVKLGSKSLT